MFFERDAMTEHTSRRAIADSSAASNADSSDSDEIERIEIALAALLTALA
jgi:hypothetical protein